MPIGRRDGLSLIHNTCREGWVQLVIRHRKLNRILDKHTYPAMYLFIPVSADQVTPRYWHHTIVNMTLEPSFREADEIQYCRSRCKRIVSTKQWSCTISKYSALRKIYHEFTRVWCFLKLKGLILIIIFFIIWYQQKNPNKININYTLCYCQSNIQQKFKSNTSKTRCVILLK